MVYCIRCDEEVKELTKTTGTCPTCAKEEVETGNWNFDIDAEDTETMAEAEKCNIIVEANLRKEGYELDGILDRTYNKEVEK